MDFIEAVVVLDVFELDRLVGFGLEGWLLVALVRGESERIVSVAFLETLVLSWVDLMGIVL